MFGENERAKVEEKLEISSEAREGGEEDGVGGVLQAGAERGVSRQRPCAPKMEQATHQWKRSAVNLKDSRIHQSCPRRYGGTSGMQASER